MRPRLLDLFCGAGGCSAGYQRAGFDVVGVDLNPQPRYPWEFHQADAMTYPLHGFDVIHASPPCQDHSSLSAVHDGSHGTGWMLAETIQRLKDAGLPWVVENVEGPTVSMDGWWVTLCGTGLGLGVRRHRRFGSNVMLMSSGCRHDLVPLPMDVTGHSPSGHMHRAFMALNGRPPLKADKEAAMGIDWMTSAELSQAIPPAYTEFLGGQLLCVSA